MISFFKKLYFLFNNINYLSTLNYDILQNICAYLKYYELIELSKADFGNKDLQKTIKLEYDYQKNILDKFLINLNRYKIIKSFENTFIPIGLIKKFPILEFQNIFLGNTNYIDSILQSHLKDPIMIGVDCFNRPFIVVKYNCNNITYILTVFQRYSDCKSLWVKCDSNNYGPILRASNTSLNNLYKKQFIKNVCQLVNKQMVSVIDKNFQLNELKCNI